MKFKFLFLILVLVPAMISASAQDYKSFLNMNAQFSNYLNENYSPVNPGIEFLYENKIVSQFSVSAGINYGYSSWDKSIGGKSYFKRRYHELFVPVVLKGRISDGFSAAIGIYPGWLASGKEIYKGSSSTSKWSDNTHNTTYNESSKFATDLFFGLELFNFVKPSKMKHAIKFTPFFKYRLNKNWLDESRDGQTSIGLKVNYLIGLK